MRTADGKLLDALAIRDTAAHDSSSIGNAKTGELLLVAQNTLNQAVSLQYQGSVDNGATWISVGSAISVTATSGTDKQTLTDGWPLLRVRATCSVSPASGLLTVYWYWKEGAI